MIRIGDEGVSPIIGTILMVAITVVVAAVVWVTVSAIEKKTEPAPAIAFYKDPSGPSVMVVRVEPGVDWANEIAFRGTCAPTLNGAPFPDNPGTTIHPGDILTCEPGETLIIIATKPNQKLYETTFA